MAADFQLPDGEAGRRRTVIAYTSDHQPVTIGPVNREASLEKLRKQAESLGLTIAEPEARHFSAASFAALAEQQTAAAR